MVADTGAGKMLKDMQFIRFTDTFVSRSVCESKWTWYPLDEEQTGRAYRDKVPEKARAMKK